MPSSKSRSTKKEKLRFAEGKNIIRKTDLLNMTPFREIRGLKLIEPKITFYGSLGSSILFKSTQFTDGVFIFDGMDTMYVFHYVTMLNSTIIMKSAENDFVFQNSDISNCLLKCGKNDLCTNNIMNKQMTLTPGTGKENITRPAFTFNTSNVYATTVNYITEDDENHVQLNANTTELFKSKEKEHVEFIQCSFTGE